MPAGQVAPPKQIVEPPYFSNWADQFMPPLANFLLPLVLPFKWLTPNVITVTSFVLYALGSVMLFASNVPGHLYYTAALLPIAYILDCMDGQVARTKKQYSNIGDYMDKTLDVLKIFILTASLSLAVYDATHHILDIFLGFAACAFFNYRYYIKLETIFGALNNDPQYLQKSYEYRQAKYAALNKEHAELKKTFVGKICHFLFMNRAIFAVDEAEFVLFTAVAALFGRLELVLWVFAVSQTAIGLFRFFEKGYQISRAPEQLLRPMRK